MAKEHKDMNKLSKARRVRCIKTHPVVEDNGDIDRNIHVGTTGWLLATGMACPGKDAKDLPDKYKVAQLSGFVIWDEPVSRDRRRVHDGASLSDRHTWTPVHAYEETGEEEGNARCPRCGMAGLFIFSSVQCLARCDG